MSTQYKLKKYFNKMKYASSVEKMDAYYAKLREYKMAQSGGYDGPWRGDLKDSVEKIKKIGDIKVSIEKNIGENKGKIEDMAGTLDAFSQKSKNIGVALADSLLFLKEITDDIGTTNIDVTMMETLGNALTSIDTSKYKNIDPQQLWKMIKDGKKEDEINKYVDETYSAKGEAKVEEAAAAAPAPADK